MAKQPLTSNAAARKEVEWAAAQQEKQLRQAQADLALLLHEPAGRRWLRWLLQQLQPRTQLWNTNASLVGFNAARHDVGTWLRNQIDDANPDAVVLMAIEQRDEDKQEQAERAARRVKRATATTEDNEDDQAPADRATRRALAEL